MGEILVIQTKLSSGVGADEILTVKVAVAKNYSIS